MKKLAFAALLLACVSVHAQPSVKTGESTSDLGWAMGKKVGGLPVKLEICGRYSDLQKAELREVLTQLQNRFTRLQGKQFAVSYRQGFQAAAMATSSWAEHSIKTMPPNVFAAACSQFSEQYPSILAGLRWLAEE